MNMTDVDEDKKAERLKAAIPENVTKDMGAEEINQMIRKEAGKLAPMEPDDFAKFMKIDNLPSKYLCYSEKEIIYGRPLNIRELKKIANITQNTVTTAIDDVLRSATRGIALEEILVSDKLYILLWLRANTYPESGYSVPFVCPECDSQSTYDFKVDNIDINYIREDVTFEEPLELSNGNFVVFKYPRIKDEHRIEKFKNSVKKSFKKYDDDILNITMAIDTINGKNMTVMEMYDFVADTKIYSQIKGYAEDFNFGISSAINVKCNKCGGTTPTGLTFREDFIIPPYKFAKSSRNGISNQRRNEDSNSI